MLYRNLSGGKGAKQHAAKLVPASLQKQHDSLTNGVHLCWHGRGQNQWLCASPLEKKNERMATYCLRLCQTLHLGLCKFEPILLI